jgi:hypothetical protein
MKIKDRYIEESIAEYFGWLLFGILMSIVMTILSIEAYYTKDIGFGFLVVFGIMSYIWTIVCIVIGIRELVVVRNNKILNEINMSVAWLLDEIEVRDKINTKLYKELKQCKKQIK